MIIQMYNENCVARRLKLKRRSIRHVSEVRSIASEFIMDG